MKPEEDLHSFPYSETIEGIQHNYRITENGDRYDIELDGIFIAEVAHDDHWQQLSGKPLNNALLESICEQIEAHQTNTNE